ncbi:hypothetical protein D5R81_06785 [Parashewanella spongiae]|uniref:Uncharacterized protein n=1 Tax=Parashewanella spongiae TaxID=342950 RepID=A0A3A6U2A6_9GAMM|nr:hypothetical protein [Parashewanella spongiae]MCL1077630.1 hypothetical protein [Parashewanella spongiae]RJY18143.1 hypothetical protein D5R81_06785 [Parashewanella spongiae]
MKLRQWIMVSVIPLCGCGVNLNSGFIFDIPVDPTMIEADFEASDELVGSGHKVAEIWSALSKFEVAARCKKLSQLYVMNTEKNSYYASCNRQSLKYTLHETGNGYQVQAVTESPNIL